LRLKLRLNSLTKTPQSDLLQSKTFWRIPVRRNYAGRIDRKSNIDLRSVFPVLLRKSGWARWGFKITIKGISLPFVESEFKHKYRGRLKAECNHFLWVLKGAFFVLRFCPGLAFGLEVSIYLLIIIDLSLPHTARF
jgi:hypothetical protein